MAALRRWLAFGLLLFVAGPAHAALQLEATQSPQTVGADLAAEFGVTATATCADFAAEVARDPFAYIGWTYHWAITPELDFEERRDVDRAACAADPTAVLSDTNVRLADLKPLAGGERHRANVTVSLSQSGVAPQGAAQASHSWDLDVPAVVQASYVEWHEGEVGPYRHRIVVEAGVFANVPARAYLDVQAPRGVGCAARTAASFEEPAPIDVRPGLSRYVGLVIDVKDLPERSQECRATDLWDIRLIGDSWTPEPGRIVLAAENVTTTYAMVPPGIAPPPVEAPQVPALTTACVLVLGLLLVRRGPRANP